MDEQIKASESARQYAEEKLIEMALQKIDVTEALKKVDEALEKIATRMRGGGNVDKELVSPKFARFAYRNWRVCGFINFSDVFLKNDRIFWELMLMNKLFQLLQQAVQLLHHRQW